MLNSRSVGSCNRCAYNKAKLNRTVYNYFKTVNNQYVTNAKHFAYAINVPTYNNRINRQNFIPTHFARSSVSANGI